jgi:hypothetical protein
MSRIITKGRRISEMLDGGGGAMTVVCEGAICMFMGGPVRYACPVPIGSAKTCPHKVAKSWNYRGNSS